MDNAEEVMQLLEEFSKMKPKEIPRELDEYLGYVAKTGDPVYQWSLIKCLFREKLLNVITDFYESTPTIDLPPSPNVDPFNYERMKASLLERLDSFNSAPFTVQRICELLTNPRKEYNRADKFMRAIEKNILVVSTREPGPGRRLECDNQIDAVLNGIPDTKLNDSQESIVNICSYHSPVAETLPVTSENDINTNVEQEEIEIDNTTEVISGSGKNWDKSVTEATLSLNVEEVTLQYKTQTEEPEKTDDVAENSRPTSEHNEVVESSETKTITDNPETTPDIQNESCDKTSNDNIEGNVAEPSPTCEEVVNFEISVVSIQSSEVQCEEETTESSAENVNTEPNEDSSNEVNPEETGNESKENTNEVSITEIATSNKLEDADPEATIPTVEFPPSSGPLSPEAESNSKSVVEDDKTPPDSSSGLISEEKGPEEIESANEEVTVEASAPEPLISEVSDTVASDVPKEEENVTVSASPSSSDDVIKTEENSEVVTETVSAEEVISSDDSVGVKNEISSALVESTDEVLQVCEQDRREGSVIQSAPVNMATDVETIMEEISVDQTAEEETEAMDVDESSNQPMIVSEGENEGEPMDQCDQPQS